MKHLLPNTPTVTLVGYGSLMNEASVQTSCQDYTNFRTATLSGFQRHFNKVQTFCLRRGVDPNTQREAAVLCIRPAQKSDLIVSLIDVPRYAVPEFWYREHDYTPQTVIVTEANGKKTEALAFVGYENETEFRAKQTPLSQEIWKNWSPLYTGPVYRNDLLPSLSYLEICLQGAKQLGEAAYQNFLDSTLLADGTTTLRTYLTNHKEITP